MKSIRQLSEIVRRLRTGAGVSKKDATALVCRTHPGEHFSEKMLDRRESSQESTPFRLHEVLAILNGSGIDIVLFDRTTGRPLPVENQLHETGERHATYLRQALTAELKALMDSSGEV